MAIFKILKIIIIFFAFFLLLFLYPFKTAAQELSITYYLSGNDIQIIYLPGPVTVNKVNVYACSVQNRSGGFQLDIGLLYEGAQVAQRGTLSYGRSGCPMWSGGGTAEGTALDFGGTSADAIKIIPVVGTGSYYQMIVYYEEGYIPPVIQCGANNTIAEYFNFSGGNFILPTPVKIHLVNAYACSVQNRNYGYRLGTGLFYNATQVAYKGTFLGGVGNELAYARSGCPMWSGGGSPPATALNFGGVIADTISINPIWGAGGIYRIFYTHEPEQCNRAAIAVATISTDGLNYGPSVTVAQGIPAPIYLSAAGSSHPDGWDKVSNGGYCEWNSDLNQGSPTFEKKIMNPPSPEDCNISLGNLTFNDIPGIYSYGALRVIDKDGIASPIASVTVTIQALPPNQPPSANNLSATQLDYCIISWPAAIFSWQFTDPDNDTQSAYQVQIDNNSNFSSPEVDTGKILSSSLSYATLQGKLSWNTTYYWQLKVWDSKDLSSSWISGSSFTVPKHQYPTINFNWAPQSPATNEKTQFTDQSIVYGGSTKSSWSWTFQDGNPANSAQQNPVVKFLSAGAKSVTLRVTDSDGFSCQIQKTVNSQLPLPEWKEIPPF